MRKFLIVSISILALALGACTREGKQNLGILNTAPDESKVSARKALTTPPDYSLRPAVTGATESAE